MKDNIEATIRGKIQDALIGKEGREEQSLAIIWTAVLINAGLGVVPFGVNIWSFVLVSTLMIVFLGRAYGYEMNNADAAKVLKQIFLSIGFTLAATTIGLKFFAEVLKGAGVITMGGATAAGMALDAALAGAVTYALGFTSRAYFESDRRATKAQLRREFGERLQEGKAQLKKNTGA